MSKIITIDMISKKELQITKKMFSLENDVITLALNAPGYDLTGKIVTAVFSPSELETEPLEVVDGVIQIPIYTSMIKKGINFIQLNFRWGTTKLEQSGKMMWVIGQSLGTPGPEQKDIDIISYLINEINTAKETAGRVVSDVGDIKTALDGSIEDAGESKVALEGSISTAGTAKSEIEQAIINNQIVTQTEFTEHVENLATKADVDDVQAQFDTVGARLDSTDAQLAQKTQERIINVDVLGAKVNDESFDNAEIIQFALDNYETVIIEGTYYTSPLNAKKKVTIRGHSTLIAFAEQNHLLRLEARDIQIENSVHADGRGLAYFGILFLGARGSNIYRVSAYKTKVYGIAFLNGGNNNLISVDFAKANECGTEYKLTYTKIDDRTIRLSSPITNEMLKEFAYYLYFPNYSTTSVNVILSVSTDGYNLNLYKRLPEDLPETGNVEIFIGGGVAILKSGANNCINITNVDTASNKGAGLECTSQYSVYISSLTSQYDRFGIATYDYSATITIGKAYFEETKVNEIYSRLYNGLTILGVPTIRGYKKQNINNGTRETIFVNRDLKKQGVVIEEEPGPREYSNDSDFSTVIISKSHPNHTVTLGFVDELHSSMRFKPITMYYIPRYSKVGTVTFKRKQGSLLTVEGHDEISFSLPEGVNAKFELVPVLGKHNQWKILKTEFQEDTFTVVS